MYQARPEKINYQHIYKIKFNKWLGVYEKT